MKNWLMTIGGGLIIVLGVWLVVIFAPQVLFFLEGIVGILAEIAGEDKAESIGKAAAMLGAGRKTKEDVIDPSVGLMIRKRVGDMVYRGECLVQIHASSREDARKAEELYLSTLTFSDEKPEKKDLILDFISY